MKNIFILFLFLCISGFSLLKAQDLRFSHVITVTSATTSTVDIYVQHLSATENMAGYTVYYYYDNTETTVTGYDSAPTATGLGWNTNNETSILFDPIPNASVGITHTGYFFYQNIDNNLMGDDISTSPVHLLTINFNHSVGTVDSGAGWLAETEEVAPMQYVGIDFIGHDVIVTGNQGQALPLELIDFQVKPLENRHALLTWKTANEERFSHFEIERSTDGQEWFFVDKKNGNGFDLQESNYSFIDKNIYAEGQFFSTFYYRLKMVDLDASFEYSELRNIEFEGKNTSISVFPSPSSGIVNFTEELSGNLIIRNVLGQVVWQQVESKAIQNIDLSFLPTGTYLLDNLGLNGELNTAKFIISRN